MNIGRFYTEQLSEGFFEVFHDGTLQKMNPGRLESVRGDRSLGKTSSAIGIDPLYLTDGEVHILLDTGLGWGLDNGSDYKKTSNSTANLEIFGIDPQDIDFVILTHLHYDHAAGSTYINSAIETTATFPNAVYLVQQDEWDFAISNQKRADHSLGVGYLMDEIYKLAAEKRIHLIDRDRFELMPGIDLLLTRGHTPGHQVVRITDGGKVAFFPGDLIPTEYHLNHYPMKRMDHDPAESKKFKNLLLREAFKNGAFLFFYHALYKKYGKLTRDRHKKYTLVER